MFNFIYLFFSISSITSDSAPTSRITPTFNISLINLQGHCSWIFKAYHKIGVYFIRISIWSPWAQSKPSERYGLCWGTSPSGPLLSTMPWTRVNIGSDQAYW